MKSLDRIRARPQHRAWPVLSPETHLILRTFGNLSWQRPGTIDAMDYQTNCRLARPPCDVDARLASSR